MVLDPQISHTDADTETAKSAWTTKDFIPIRLRLFEQQRNIMSTIAGSASDIG
jgi:hypothetical protein